VVIRCRNCHGSVWVDTTPTPGARSIRASCPGCKQRYEFDTPPSPSLARKLSNDARRLARDKTIDLPSAYSVLLGVMKPEDVHEVHPAQRAAAPAAPETARSGGPSAAFDPAFREAVESGRLSGKEAAARGRRSTYAALLASRHKLPMTTAFAVADNRLSLLQALRKHGAPALDPVRLRPGSSHLRRAAWILVGLLPVAAAAAALSGRPAVVRSSTGSATRTVGAAEILTDGSGRIVQVLGRDPRGVLAAYCLSADPHGRLDLLGVVPARSEGARARLGIFRRPNEPSAPLSITITEDRQANRWVAGNGRAPLAVSPAPPELAAPLEAAARNDGKPRQARGETDAWNQP
jgi:hypothetical protein